MIAQLLYGCGMRISEALRLRIKDIDFDQRLIEVHIRTIQELLGHADLKTTMIDTHVLNRRDVQVVSPLDQVAAVQGTESTGAPGMVEEDLSRPVGGSTLAEGTPRVEDEVGRVAPRHDARARDAGEALVASTESGARSQSARILRFRVLRLSAGRQSPADVAAKQDDHGTEPPVDGGWPSAWETMGATCRALISPRGEPRVGRRGIL